jgi:uncharacterized protein YdeI (YjbR/CyaY-like superfamily)
MSPQDDLPVLHFEDLAALEAWIAAQPDDAPGVWLKLAKKGSGHRSVTRAEAIDAGLCHGWIDGQGGTIDGAWWRQRFTPRRARSRWSKINRDRAEELLAAGRVSARGKREIDRAKADGRWDAAYDSPRNIQVPDDLRAALDSDPAAAKEFAALDGANRYAILYRIHDAKRAETRARRIATYVEMIARGERLHRR